MTPDRMRGIVESEYDRNVFVRDLEEWARWFAFIDDCADSVLPERGAIVTFTPDPHYVRGPRALDVVVVEDPALDISRVCVECRATFALTANDLAWFAAKRYTPPSRCKRCLAARRGVA